MLRGGDLILISPRSGLLIGAALCLFIDCGGRVDQDPTSPNSAIDAGSDASCVPGAPACPLPESGKDVDTDAPPSDTGSDVAAADGGTLLDAGADSDVLDAGNDDALDAPCGPADGATGPCEPIAQCGCDPDLTCALAKTPDWGGFTPGVPKTECRAFGDTAPYTHCKEGSDCLPGYGCSIGCRPTCAADTDCQSFDPLGKCIFLKYSPSGSFAGPFVEGPYGYCTRECDPADPTSSAGEFLPCGSGYQCQPTDHLTIAPLVGESGHTDCSAWAPLERLKSGEPCTSDPYCDPGYSCAAPPGDGGGGDAAPVKVCRHWCHAGDVSACAGKACIPTGIYAGKTELGLCVP